mmetsp:Transcript_2699/g.7989  ORF Transcript_2699/g.7989 Transcript_2699/m.7989 type:complete len:210 (-) Transcript_2699:4-633(-)
MCARVPGQVEGWRRGVGEPPTSPLRGVQEPGGAVDAAGSAGGAVPAAWQRGCGHWGAPLPGHVRPQPPRHHHQRTGGHQEPAGECVLRDCGVATAGVRGDGECDGQPEQAGRGVREARHRHPAHAAVPDAHRHLHGGPPRRRPGPLEGAAGRGQVGGGAAATISGTRPPGPAHCLRRGGQPHPPQLPELRGQVPLRSQPCRCVPAGGVG